MPSGPGTEGREITSQGDARTVFRRALERGNLMLAEVTAREIGIVDLGEALELTALMAQKGDWLRSRRAAARWLERYIAETSAAIDDAVLAAGCLAALGGRVHGEALAALRNLTSAAGSRHGVSSDGGRSRLVHGESDTDRS